MKNNNINNTKIQLEVGKRKLQKRKSKSCGDLADHKRMELTTLFLKPGMGLSYGRAKTTFKIIKSTLEIGSILRKLRAETMQLVYLVPAKPHANKPVFTRYSNRKIIYNLLQKRVLFQVQEECEKECKVKRLKLETKKN